MNVSECMRFEAGGVRTWDGHLLRESHVKCNVWDLIGLVSGGRIYITNSWQQISKYGSFGSTGSGKRDFIMMLLHW